jgi:lipopolysaccharide transport protein LptA
MKPPFSTENGRWRAAFMRSLLGAVLFLGVAAATAQPTIVLKNFNQILGSYEPPHETQAKCRLRGDEARPVGSNLYAVTNAELETYTEDGQRQMIVQAPQCIYDATHRSASSTGRLRVQTADGGFSIEGDGFTWIQTNSSMVISNHVHSVVQPELLEPAAGNPLSPRESPGTPPVNVSADQFDYSGESGVSTYRGDVRVTGTNFVLTSGKLIVKLPLNERQLQDLTAQDAVVLDYEKTHAEADQMVYSAKTGRVEMTGHPSWRTEGREGRGDDVILDRTNKLLRAVGEAYLKTPAQNLGTSGLFGGPKELGKEPSSATNQTVEINCESYELRPERAEFHQSVQAEMKTGDQLQGRLTCGELTATFPGTNQPPTVVAENQVRIEQTDRLLTAGHAVYTGVDEQLKLTQEPRWRAGEREGKGDEIVLLTSTNQMTVRGDAWLRLPAGELGQVPGLAPATVKAAAAQAGPSQFAEVSSSEYRFSSEEARFFGQVHLKHPQMDWTCEDLNVRLGGNAQPVQSLVAERAVSFDLTNEQGNKLHGTGDHSVYTSTITPSRTNSILRLTGQPAVLQTTNGVFENSVFILDLGQNMLLAPGRYKIRALEAMTGTNATPVLEKRRRRR